MIFRPALFALLALSAAPLASAQVLQEKNLPLDIASEIAQQTVQICLAEGYNVTAAVVDRAGTLRALMRADKATPHTVSASQRKAYTSASTRTPTSTLAENIQKNPGASQMAAIDGFLFLGGGVPIKAGDDVIGAVGVGGAPGGHLDEACALKAIEKVQAKLK